MPTLAEELALDGVLEIPSERVIGLLFSRWSDLLEEMGVQHTLPHHALYPSIHSIPIDWCAHLY